MLLALAVPIAAAGCASTGVATIPAPPATVASPPTTVAPLGSAADLAAVPGATTSTTVALGPGAATLRGTVTGPAGPVPDAIVQVERVVDGVSAQGTTTTAADGTWNFANVLGGAYRVRAWRAPDLALTQPVDLFLAGTEVSNLSLQLQKYQGDQVTSALAPDPPVVGQPAQLVVQVAAASVNPASGAVDATPVAGTVVQVNGSAAWEVDGPDPSTTGANGQVSWLVTCTIPGSQALQVVLADGTSYPLDHVLACVRPAAPATTTTTSTTPVSTVTTSPGSSTSTTG